MKRDRILVIGAAGQIGTELTLELRKVYGNDQVYATDIKMANDEIVNGGPFQILDVMDDKMLIHFIIRNKITHIYLLAAVLSGNAEKLPVQAWNINMESLLNVLEIAKMVDKVKKIFWPSSIAVFGPTTQKKDVPQLAVMEPTTVYGISKLAGERWCYYYQKKYDLDIRSLRYPGLISYKTEAGGGTTDYAVEIFFEAIEDGYYECCIEQGTYMPFLFMSDAIEATVKLMQRPRKQLTVHSSYNMGGISLKPEDFADAIREYLPNFKMVYKPDFRQEIASSWPDSINDVEARKDWDYDPKMDLKAITKIMLKEAKNKLAAKTN